METDTDLPKLQKAYDKFEKTASHINARKKESQSSEMVFTLHSTLSGLSSPLVTASRRFVKEGNLDAVFSVTNTKKTKPVTLYLFNDLIVVAKSKPDWRGKRAVLREFPLEELQKVQLIRVGDDDAMIVVPDDSTLSCVFCDKKNGSVKEWISEIIETENSLKKMVSSLRRK